MDGYDIISLLLMINSRLESTSCLKHSKIRLL